MKDQRMIERLFGRLGKFLRRPARWFDDSVFRKLWQNAAILLSGNLLSILFDFVSLVVTARALGPAAFGVFVLIQTYVLVVDNLFNFQSWQAVIKYGADTQGVGREGQFRSLIKFGTMLDVASAVFATCVALACIVVFGDWQNLDPEDIRMAMFFCIIILFNLQGTPTAVLRLFDRFGLLASQRAIVSFIKMAALSVAFLLGASIWTFLALWIASYLANYLVLLWLGWRELYRQGCRNVFAASAREIYQKHPGVIRFVVSTNLSSAIRLVPAEFDVLLVGLFLGPSQAGIYKVARQFGMVPVRFASPLQDSIYPNMAKLWSGGETKKFISFIMRLGAMAGVVGVASVVFFLLFGPLVIRLTVGPEFSAAYVPLVVYMVGVCIYMFGVAFRPAILSMGHADRILVVYAVSTTIYIATLLYLLPAIGVVGASVSQVVFHSCWFVMMTLSIYGYKRSDAGFATSGSADREQT